jgi:hypothetical protein
MFATGYKNYFLRILFASEKEFGPAFSLVVEISQAPGRKPVATIYVSEPIATEREGILRGFEIGREWVDKISHHLSSPIPVAKRTMVHSAQLITELHDAIANSLGVVLRSENLIDRSHSLSVAASAQRSGSPDILVAPRQRFPGHTQVMPRQLIAEHLAQRAVITSPPPEKHRPRLIH